MMEGLIIGEGGREGAAVVIRTFSRVPRPRKRRLLDCQPQEAIYKPAGVPLDRVRCVKLLQEELEALRLADLEGLTQQAASERMGVSRSTFQRIVNRARRQVALALAEGHALHIEGGTFEVRQSHPQNSGRRDQRDSSDTHGLR